MTDSLFGEISITPKKVAKPKRKSTKATQIGESINLENNKMFGEDFTIATVKKTKAPKEEREVSAEQKLKSKKLSLNERLAIINTNVLKVLGKQKANVLVIKDKETFIKYIDKAIQVGRIAIDTETNNSLDPITCKLMGLCLFVPGEKQAYIPIHHRNPDTQEHLAWQLTEADCKEQLQRILDAKTYIVMHNGKFDYKVIKCTCDIEVEPNWDTMIAAKVLDENEFSAGLKQQYISKIDKSQEKYSIDHLFESIEYADVDPDIFALYAATDSMMTDALYLWQKPRLEAYKNEPGPCGKSAYDLFMDVEMPCIISTAKMELNGIRFDKEYANRLKIRFEGELAEIDTKINEVMSSYAQIIKDWRADKENNKETNVYVAEKTKMSKEKIETMYPFIDAEGRRYKKGKSKVSQLEDPISLSSPTQLAILLFDILKLDNDGDRGTGEEVLEKLKKQTPLAELLLKRRGIVKLLDAFINSLPENVNQKTGKIHCHFNQYGAATGRFSSSEPNLQQIPSHMKSIRMLFTADIDNHEVELTNNYYEIPEGDEVETTIGWKKIKDIKIGDIIVGKDNKDIVKNIIKNKSGYLIYID